MSKTPLSGGEMAEGLNVQEEVFHLRVARSSLRPADKDASPNLNPPTVQSYIHVLMAKISDVYPFSGGTAKWLMEVAKLIFDPRGRGELFTHPMGSTDEQCDPLSPKWVKVLEHDLIKPQIYEYRCDGTLTLSKISLRQDESRTSRLSKPQSTLLFTQLIQRDRICVLSGVEEELGLAVSRLIPKRVGDKGILEIGKRYVGAGTIERFDPSVAILLNKMLKAYVEFYEVGFYHIEGDTYIAHSFYEKAICMYGFDSEDFPPLHGHLVTLSTRNSSVSIPPPGIMGWHYLQCVLRHFATEEYKALPDISEEERLFKVRDDDSDEEGDEEDDEEGGEEHLYPSYRMDQYVSHLAEQQRTEETNGAIAQWRAEVHST